MNPISGIFNGSDDLFKFMVIGGVFLLVFGMMYPLEKEKELKLKKISLNKEGEKIEAQDSLLLYKLDEMNSFLDKCRDSASNLLSKKEFKKAYELKEKVDKRYLELKEVQLESRKSRITLDSKTKEISILDEYIIIYNSFSNWLIGTGIILSLIGLIFWGISQKLSLINKRYQTDIIKVKRDAKIKS